MEEDKDNLIKNTIKGDEEYYGQEDIIQRSVRGVGEMFRHLGNPHFDNIRTFVFAYFFALFLLGQALFVLIFFYYYLITFQSSYLIELPIFLAVVLEGLFVAVLSLKILFGMNSFLKKRQLIYRYIFLVSVIFLISLMVLFFKQFILFLPFGI